MFESLIVAAMLGQAAYVDSTVYYEPTAVVYGEPTVEYWFGNWSKKTEFQGKALYGKTWRTVPVVNGFAPEIKKRGRTVIYDYRKRILYSKCAKPQKKTYPPPSETKPLVPVNKDKRLRLLRLPPEAPKPPVPSYRYEGLKRPSDVK